MKNIFTFLMVLALSTYSTNAQVVLQDFSKKFNNNLGAVYGGFGGGLTATNDLVADPVDSNNTVREYTTAAGGDIWKGIFVRPQTHYIDLTTTKSVSVKVYSTTSTYVKGKIQAGQSNQTAIELATSVSHNGSGWQTLTFSFPSSATGEWGEFVLFTNVDASGNFVDPATQVITVYIDDISAAQGSAIPTVVTPTNSPTAPTRAAADVISIYSDAYTDIATNYNPSWNQAGSVIEDFDPGDGSKILAYTNFDYQGTILTPTDVSSMENLHIDIWVEANVRTVKISPILSAGSPTEFLVTVPVTAGAWNSVDIPLTSFTGLDFSNTVKELKFDGQFKTDGATADKVIRSAIFLDNIYFYKAPTASIEDLSNSFAIYPNPMGSQLTVEGISEVQHASIFDLTGREVLRATPNKAVFTLDTADLQSGVYMLSLQVGDNEITKKLMK